MISLEKVDWERVKAVIFDVDGTLYNQSRLRSKMLFDLLGYYALRPWRLQEMRILQKFRAEREKRPGQSIPDLQNAQYTWCADAGGYPLDKVKRVVDYWMFHHPNQYLTSCVYPGAQSFFSALRQRGITIGIYSDYPAQDKLDAMNLAADIIVSSTDPHINHLKPAPQGLLHLTAELGLSPAECLFIGDRPELDGICAERAGMPCLIVDKQPFDQFSFYTQLENQLVATLTTPAHG